MKITKINRVMLFDEGWEATKYGDEGWCDSCSEWKETMEYEDIDSKEIEEICESCSKKTSPGWECQFCKRWGDHEIIRGKYKIFVCWNHNRLYKNAEIEFCVKEDEWEISKESLLHCIKKYEDTKLTLNDSIFNLSVALFYLENKKMGLLTKQLTKVFGINSKIYRYGTKDCQDVDKIIDKFLDIADNKLLTLSVIYIKDKRYISHLFEAYIDELNKIIKSTMFVL